MKAHAVPCHFHIFKQSITGTFVQGAFLVEIMAQMILSGCFRHAIEYINIFRFECRCAVVSWPKAYTEYINNYNAHTFSCDVTDGQLTGQLNLFTVHLHHNMIKGT